MSIADGLHLFYGTDKIPSIVHYARGRHVFTDSTSFFMRPAKPGPSDSTWIVPGTER